MTTESPRPDSHAPAAGTGAGFQRFVDGYRAMPMAERILGAAATAFLLGFIFNNLWDRLFKFGGYYGSGWFITLGFFGSVLVLALLVLKLAGVRTLEPPVYLRTLVVLALLPAVGFLIDGLKDFWGFVMLLAMVVMAYAAAKITTRENIIRR